MKPLRILFLALIFASCMEKEVPLTAQQIVDRAIATTCDESCDHATIDFTFRDRCYVSKRNGDSFQLERITSDSSGVTHDVLSNMELQKFD
jgi:hypothetical protein